MSKQNKIEKSQKAKEAAITILPLVIKVGDSGTAFESAKVGERFYQIKGLPLFSKTKEGLKAKRRELNLSSGIHEVDTNGLGAHPSNEWPYRVSKGPDHPHFANA